MTQLEQLIDQIDPNRTSSEVASRIDEARNSFHLSSSTVSSWAEFCTLLARFFAHLEGYALNMVGRRPSDQTFDFSRAMNLLRKTYGPNTETAACQIAMSSVEGGLRRVLDDLASAMIAYYSENEIEARINQFWASLSSDEKLETCQEFLDKYGSLLPSEVTVGSAPRLKAYFPSFLAKLPALLRRLRNSKW
jgi:hypothetical protein